MFSWAFPTEIVGLKKKQLDRGNRAVNFQLRSYVQSKHSCKMVWQSAFFQRKATPMPFRVSGATNLRLWARHRHQPQCEPSHIIPRLISSHLQWKREASPKSSTSSMGSASPPSCQTWIGRGSWSCSAKPRPICWGMSASNLAGQNKLSLTCIVQGLEFQALVQGLEFQALEPKLGNH